MRLSGLVLHRLAEVTAATVLLAILSPAFLAVALVIRLDDGGPAIFRQRRIGRGKHEFTIYKFRTMATSASDEDHQREVLRQLCGGGRLEGDVAFKAKNDPRVTRVGMHLRRFSIDELPQLLNVLRGDMSFVGPRPPLVDEAASYPAWADARFNVKPGITGLWQVTGRNELDLREMLALDVEYALNQRLSTDVVIIGRTVPVVLSGRGAA